MKQAQVKDTVELVDGVRVLPAAPNNGAYVNLYKRQSGEWCAQLWTTVDGQPIADYTDDHATKARALQDAFRVAKDEDLPFVAQADREQRATYVPSTVADA